VIQLDILLPNLTKHQITFEDKIIGRVYSIVDKSVLKEEHIQSQNLIIVEVLGVVRGKC